MILFASLVFDLALLVIKCYRTRNASFALRFISFAAIINTVAYYMIIGFSEIFLPIIQFQTEYLLFQMVCTISAKIFVIWVFQQSVESTAKRIHVYVLAVMLSLCLHGNPIKGIATETILFLFLLNEECYDIGLEKKKPVNRQESDLYLQTIEDSYRKNRALMHDLKNHIIVLRTLAEQKEYDKFFEYTDTLSEKVSENLFPVHSGDVVLDALLADKYHAARRNQIFVEFVDVRYHINFDSSDLCTVIGNLFDNAIAENLKTSCVEDRRISVSIRTTDGSMLIEMKNPLFHELTIKNGLPASDKPDSVHHGIGLRNVRRVCNTYGGELLWNDYDGVFTVTVQLKITESR